MRLSFHQAGRVGCCSLGDGRYVFLPSDSPQAFGTLIDESTGTRKSVSPPPGFPTACSPTTLIGGPWLADDCGPAYAGTQPTRTVELYSLADSGWRTIPIASRIADLGAAARLTGAGAQWLKFTVSYYHGAPTGLFQNIVTGAVQADPTRRHVVPALNSQTLARRICAPVSVPYERPDPAYGGGGFGTITFAGRDALAVNLGDELYLERCGSSRQVLLCRDLLHLSIGRQLAVWLQYNARRLDGIVLRSHRRLEIPLPPIQASDYYASVTLGLHTIYVTRGDGELLTASIS